MQVLRTGPEQLPNEPLFEFHFIGAPSETGTPTLIPPC